VQEKDNLERGERLTLMC